MMDVLNDKVSRLFRKFLVPSLFSAASISIFGFVDMLSIGQGVGENGVAVFGVAYICLAMFQRLFGGIGRAV